MSEIDNTEEMAQAPIDPPVIEEVQEFLPIAPAIEILAPGCVWSLVGDDYEGLVWESDINLKPTKEAVLAKAQELKAERPMKKLRQLRDYRLKEVDWVTLRAMRTGEPVPQEWRDYMQALADITETSTPRFVGGQLVGVEWPERPDGVPAGLAPGLQYR